MQDLEQNDVPMERFSDVLAHLKSGEIQFLPSVILTKQQPSCYWSVCHGMRIAKNHSIATTSLEDVEQTLIPYALRFGTEPMNKDFKGNGYDLERTKVTHAKRIDTMMIICAFAKILLFTFGKPPISRLTYLYS